MDDDFFDNLRLPRERPSLTDELNHPNHWFNRSSDLRASAGALWFVMDDKVEAVADRLGLEKGFSMGIACRPVYHMLCGLAIELILKAVIVQNGLKVPQSHDLNYLASQLSLILNPHEKNLLIFYKASIEWSGRYPTPAKCDDDSILKYWKLATEVLTKPMVPDTNKSGTPKFRTASDATSWTNFNTLWARVASEFKFSS